VVLILFPASFLLAQDSSSLVGVVTDTTGAVIPGASVTLSNPSTGVTFTQTTNNTGSYRFLDVPPNTGYKVSFSQEGFAVEEISNITLNVGITRTQNAKLIPGRNVETIKVSAGNEQVTLNTTDASIGNNIDVEELNDLPIYDRTAGITTLFYQQAGVDSNQAAVTGARIDQSAVSVDGLDVNDLATGQAFGIVGRAPVDSVEQFTGTVGGLVSSLGTGSGGQFQLVTKNGTNKFHGNVNEYHRDTTTEANTWFNNHIGLARTPLIRNQFGGNFGGPALKDKLFFFFDLADSKIVQSGSAERTVPLAAYRAGTLNYINNGAGCTYNSRLNTQAGCITTLSANGVAALDPGGIGFSSSELSFINSRYPTANDLTYGDGVNTGGYLFTSPTPDNDTTYVTRVDYNLTPTQKIFGRFTINRRNAIESLPEFKSDPVTHPYVDRSYSYVISHTWDIGKNKVNQFYYGDTISKYNFPDTYNPTGANQYSFSGGISGPYTSFDGQKRRIPIPIVRDDFSWQRGQHSLTFGGTFKFIKTNSQLITNFNFPGIGEQGNVLGSGLDSYVRPSDILIDSNNVGVIDYDGLFANALGVIGDVSTNFVYTAKGTATAAGSGNQRAYRFFQTEGYFGDTWKVSKKLTLSYGVRYQLYSVPYETHGSQSSSVDLSTGKPISLNTYIADRQAQGKAGDSSNGGLPFYSYVLGGKANHGPDLYGMSYKDFEPRFAFSYTPYNSQKTVFNGGIGLVYDRNIIDAIAFLLDQVPNMFAGSQTSQFGADSAGKYPSVIDASLASDPRVGDNLSYSSTLNPAPASVGRPYTPYVDGTGTPYGLAAGETNFVIDSKLKDPYSIALNFGLQQELPGHMVLKLNYVGRLGRRLLADADGSQVLDVPDYTGKSTQTMAGAFGGLTKQLRAGATAGTVTPEPWFEDVLNPVFGPGKSTKVVTEMVGVLGARGDMSDMLQALAFYSSNYGYGYNFLPTNIGIPSQFGTNAYLTNMGSSNYHGLLLTLDKNLSQGLRFEFNYTWSHSIDNTSLSANNNALFSNSGMICDVTQPRACRGNSDFDVRQEISSNFQYDLPVGRGKTYLSNAPRWADEAIGGWGISGLPMYRTGLAVTASSDAYLASFDNSDPAIFTGSKADLKTKVNTDASGVVWTFAGGQAGAAKVFSEFRGPIGLEYGQRNLMRGPGALFLDMGLGKTFPILPGNELNLKFRADAFNLLNHPDFGTGGLNIVSNASQFGQITGTVSGPNTGYGARVAQFSLRLEF